VEKTLKTVVGTSRSFLGTDGREKSSKQSRGFGDILLRGWARTGFS
jgi:hypothetical protein